MTEPDRPQMTT